MRGWNCSLHRLAMSLAVLGSLSVNGLCGTQGKAPQQSSSAHSKWKLVWSDEFNGPDGSRPDSGKWNVLNNDSGFGNGELEYYTDRPVNAHLQNGNLVITAQKEVYKGADGAVRQFTSGRLESEGHFQLQYGRVEARIKMPKGQGIWPAFWMLGANFKSADWPSCGEIDTMENIGREPSTIHGSLHGPGYSGGNPLTGEFTLPDHQLFSDGFHVFAVEWEADAIRFYVDNKLYETQTAANLPSSKPWAFNHPFFILLNVAVGGYWPGNPDETTAFPTSMLVDYVRVYRLEKGGEENKSENLPGR